MGNPGSNILLIAPYTRSFTQRMPLGLMYISSYLTAHGEENSILDFKGISEDEARNKTEKALIELKPSFVGLTCLCSEMETIKQLTDFIKLNLPESIIVIGGPHASSSPQHFLEMEIFFHFLVLGEGEMALLELISCLKNKSNIEDVQGIAFVVNSEIKYNTPRPLIEDLDVLPLPAYDKVDMNYYCRPNVWAIRPIYLSALSIFSSRGCPYGCKFCVEFAVFGRRVRYVSPEKVIEHIKFLIDNYKIDALFFFDEAFTLSKEHVKKIFRLYKENNLKILWGCQTRINLLDEELLSIFKANGCIQVDFGIESGSDKMLKIMNKGLTVEKIVEIGKLCNKTGVRHLANMLINVPGENMEDIEMSLSLVNRIKYNVVLWNVYIPFPGVSIGKSIGAQELSIMQDASQALNLLETKYKFGNYTETLQSILNRLYSLSFHPKHFKVSFHLSYWTSFVRLFSYLFDPRYIRAILTSKRRKEYFKNLFNQNFKT